MADIEINPVTRRLQYTGNTGVGPFSFNFNILADGDIAVYKNTTLLTLTSEYTVSTNADGTGSITLTGTGNGTALVLADVLTIIGGRLLERTTDFVAGGDFFAAAINEQLDSQVIMAQQLDEKLGRSLKVNPGDTYTDLELPLKADRLNRVLQFNASTGDPEAGPTVDDVENAQTYANNAATSATAAAASETAAASSATAASASETAAAASETAAASSATNAAASESAAATSASNAATSETNAATSATNAATSATNAASSATSAASAQTAAESARDATLAAYDNFDDRYLGTKASDPTLDNDGNALVAGSLYFNTTAGEMKVYTGSLWVAAYVSGTGFLTVANNLSDLANAATARTNLGLGTTDSPTFAGLTVDTNTLHVDSTNKRVGVRTSSPSTELDVAGTITAEELVLTGGRSVGIGFSTRASAAAEWAAMVAAGETPPVGTIWSFDGVSIEYDGSTTAVPDFSGWKPVAPICILHFGTKSASNNSTALQAAVDYVLSSGKGAGEGVYIPPGSWPFATEILIDLSSLSGYPNSQNRSGFIYGSGERSTVLKAQTDSMNIVRVLGANPLTTASYAYQTILSDLSLAGNSPTSRSTFGLEIEDVAFWSLKNVGAFNLNAALVLTGALSGHMSTCHFRENTYGIKGVNSASHVNAVTLDGCNIQGATEIGIEITGGCSNLTFLGGSVEQCGTHGDSATGGIYLSGSGSQGEASLTMLGTYVEDNEGGFDVKVAETGGNKMTAYFSGCTFQRISSSGHVVSQIVTTGDVIVTTNGCSFTKGSTYSADAGRPYLNIGSGGRHVSIGDRYEDSVEAPRIDQGGVFGGFVTGSLGASVTGNVPLGWSVSQISTGLFRVTHNFGHTDYAPLATIVSSNSRFVERIVRNSNSFDVRVLRTADNVATDDDFAFQVHQYGGVT